jgi:hypothetical protein
MVTKSFYKGGISMASQRKRVSQSKKYTVDRNGNRIYEYHVEVEWEVTFSEETPRKTPWSATVAGILILAVIGNWLTAFTEKAAACATAAKDCMASVLENLHAIIVALLS